MTSLANRNFAIFTPFSVLELDRYIVLNKLLCLIFTIIGCPFKIDTVTEMFLD